MATAVISDFVGTIIWWQDCSRDAIFSLFAKFCENMCNCDQVKSVKRNSKWRPPTSGNYLRRQFWSHGLFPVVADYIPAKFHKFTSTGGGVIAFCGKADKLIVAASAILNYYMVILDHARSLLVDRKWHIKFHVDRSGTFQDIVIWKFCKITLICPQFFRGWGVGCQLLNLFFPLLRSPKGNSLPETRVLSPHWSP